jgi:hypothetical protein
MTQLEQVHQTKILNKLIKDGFHAIKIIQASKNGEPDIVAIESPTGRFWGIEVKRDIKSELPPLQRAKLEIINAANGVAFCAYGWEDFCLKYKAIQTGWYDYNSFLDPYQLT